MFKPFPLLEKSIRNQFLKTLMTLIVVFLITMLTFFIYVKSSNQSLQKERDSVREKAVLVDELEESINEIFFRARGYYAFQNDQELNLLNENLEEFEILLGKYSELRLTKEERELYNELVDFHKNYKTIILPKAISFVKANDYASLRKLSNSGTNDLVNKFVSYTKAYKKKTDVDLNQIFTKTIEQAQQFTLIALILSGLILFLVTVIMWRVLYNLIRPIEQLTTATNAIATGRIIDLGGLVQREDELGILTNSFQNMTKSIQEKEEVLTTQNEELIAQQDELQENQSQLQHSLNQLQKYNQLNHALTFTLNKQKLVENIHEYLNYIHKFDTSILYLLEGNVYVSKGLTNKSTEHLVGNLDENKRVRLEEEQSFVITREVVPEAQGIAQESYYCYDLYSSVLNSEGQLVAVMMATREGYPYSNQEIEDLNGLMNRISIAFERILMYEEVERSRQLNQNIIDNVNEGIQLVSISGDIILINKALCRIIRCQNRLEGKTTSQQTWLEHFQTLSDQPEELTSFFKKAIIENFKDTRKIRYSISQDTPVFIEVYATSVYEDMEKVGTIFVHRDITREYEVDQMKSELVSTVSHELRTPLSSVLGFTELLLTKNLKPERQKKYIETIHKEAIRLTNLINDFLDIQRMESGKQQYNMQSLAIDELAIEIVNRFRHEKNHHVHLVDKARHINVKADQERLVQVFINLVGNAIKFSPNGGDVMISLENVNEMLQVSIKDEGIGIPKNDISNLFQKFKRIDNSSRRKIGGTGLGLSISREIILKHGGEIWIESEEGQGTTVYFNLPLGNKPLSGQTIKVDDLDDGQIGLNVMIVEDDLSLALLLSEELKSKGFTVIHHNDPKRAFEDALRVPLVGVVIDLMLGDEMNGWDLVQQLKETSQTSRIPIVISSALDEAKEEVEKFKIEKYFTKPYPPEELSKILVTFLLSKSSNGNVIFPEEKRE
ncbi:ATP-binding protein [Domibacillus mangrovi]|uniref:histidine kinase n=1 Tax=Domibacillus mangrovi TaxID=1714354 RepID=A0A1Q5P3Q1_9BACI|nr:ATP-binding protein [Domibacillus mangrovi]OKL36879.1 histidine kinase [Domibacillus mangrovi]